jgi:hypothetical protein
MIKCTYIAIIRISNDTVTLVFVETTYLDSLAIKSNSENIGFDDTFSSIL